MKSPVFPCLPPLDIHTSQHNLTLSVEFFQVSNFLRGKVVAIGNSRKFRGHFVPMVVKTPLRTS
jgi:hypothetical protein